MKKIFAYGMMLAVTLSLTNCSKEIEAPVIESETIKEGVPFELFANSIETKTAITGWATRWVQGDKVNVFHATAGTTAYVDDGQFSVDATDLTVGRFTGTIAPENLPVSGKYDWYAIYPYSSYIKSPANTGSNPGRVTIGKASNQAQVQNGNNTTNHLSGYTFPLYGVVTDVDFNVSPSITLNNIVSVVEVKVTNKNDDPLTVNSVAFTAPDGTSIVGQYEINYKANPMIFTDYIKDSKAQTSNTASLTVNSGEAINKNEYASFYIGVKPFTATAGQTLKLTVNGYEKSITLPSNVTFASGKIKTLSFNFDQDPQAFTTFVFNTDAGIAELGIEKPSTGAGTTLTGPYVKNNVSLTFGGSGTAPKAWNNSGTLELRTYAANTLTFEAPSGYNITKIKLSSSGSYTSSPGSFTSDTWSGSTAQVVLTRGGSGKHAVSTIEVTCEQTVAVPTIVSKAVNDVAARGEANVETSITLSHYASAPSIPTVTPDGTVITSASVKDITATGATLVYTVSNNYTGAARQGTVTLTDSDSQTGTVTFNQVADVFSLSRTTVELNANSDASANMTVYSDYDWTIDDSSLNGFTVSPNSFTYSGNRNQIVTITATGSNTTASLIDLDVFCVTRTADSKDSDDITVKQRSAKLLAPDLTIEKDAANKKFTVSWTAVSNASKYEYYVLDKDANNFISTTQTADASTLSFEVSGINLDEDYYVAVKAIGNASPWIDSDEADEIVNVASTSTHSWVLVSSLSDIVEGRYAIAAYNSSKYYTVPSSTISGQTFTCTEAAYSATDGLTLPSNAGQFVFTAVTGVANAYYIYNTSLNKYLAATGSKKFGYVESTSTDYGYWSFSTVSSGGFSATYSVQHNSKTQYMRAYNNSVRCYDSASNSGFYLFIYQ